MKYQIISTKGRILDSRVFESKERVQIEADLFNMGSDTETAVIKEIRS